MLAKIAGAVFGAGFLTQLVKTWKSPREARETGEQHYSELFLKEIESLRDDLAQIHASHETSRKMLIEEYEARLKVYRDSAHEANNRALRYQGFLYRLGWEIEEGGKFVRVSLDSKGD